MWDLWENVEGTGEVVCVIDAVALFLLLHVPPCHAVPESPTVSPSSGSCSRFLSVIFRGNSTPPQTWIGHLPPPSLKIARVKGPGNPQAHLAEGGASLQFVRLMQSLADRGPESPGDRTLHGAPGACRGGSDQAGGGADGGTGGRHFWLPGQEDVAKVTEFWPLWVSGATLGLTHIKIPRETLQDLFSIFRTVCACEHRGVKLWAQGGRSLS